MIRVLFFVILSFLFKTLRACSYLSFSHNNYLGLRFYYTSGSHPVAELVTQLPLFFAEPHDACRFALPISHTATRGFNTRSQETIVLQRENEMNSKNKDYWQSEHITDFFLGSQIKKPY
jgi:hypothetical protein